MLWFAWKIVLLQYHKQLLDCLYCRILSCDLLEKSYFCSITNNMPRVRATLAAGCDLLEKSYFCSITNNTRATPLGVYHVVICLKNRTFAVSQTTRTRLTRSSILLWFAWKIVLLQYHKQPVSTPWAITLVVICLKNRTFAVSQTTGVSKHLLEWLLWFAWKIVLLQYHKQPDGGDIKLYCGCDLLEKSYFCSITNNFGADKR